MTVREVTMPITVSITTQGKLVSIKGETGRKDAHLSISYDHDKKRVVGAHTSLMPRLNAEPATISYDDSGGGCVSRVTQGDEVKIIVVEG